MSAIRFHQKHMSPIWLSGAEYGWYRRVVEGVAADFDQRNARGRGGDRDRLHFAKQLNTAMRLGNEFVRWMARVCGQCELHAWIHADDRLFFADLLERGCHNGLFRRSVNKATIEYPLLIDVLKAGAPSGHVVMSYTVTDYFPSNHIDGIPDHYQAGGMAEEDSEAWNNLTDDQRWDVALAVLEKDDRLLRIKPEHITTDCYRFDSGDDLLACQKWPGFVS